MIITVLKFWVKRKIKKRKQRKIQEHNDWKIERLQLELYLRRINSIKLKYHPIR